MTKILAHISNERLYSSILRTLGDNREVIGAILHENIFDIYHKIKPETVIIPIHEYSQEFHEFVEKFKDKLNIVIYGGSIYHEELIKYFNQNNIKLITSLDIASSSNILQYTYLYDSTVYKNLDLNRNDKVLVMLSKDLEKNHQLLDNILYPNTKIKLCLINNPIFKHKQNIGVTSVNDLAYVLNTYGSFIDIDNGFKIEADSCGINNISTDGDLLSNIMNAKYLDKLSNIESYSVTNFVKNQLLSFIGV